MSGPWHNARVPSAAVIANPRVAAELGHLDTWLSAKGFDVVRLVRDDVLEPTVAGDADLLISMGSVWTMARTMTDPTDPPHADAAIAAEMELCRTWVEDGRPFLGVCFGAQLLSRALGGTVTRQGQPFAGWITPSAALPQMRHPWMVWHNDAFTVPPGAELLARSAHAALAFRYRNAWGVQFHPEVDADVLTRMAHDLEAPDAAAESMVDVARHLGPQLPDQAFALFDRFWTDVAPGPGA